MSNKLFFHFLGAVLLLCSLVVPAAAEGWMTDYSSAVKKAKAEQKLVLVDFTGSDWCSPCMILRRNVLDNADFRAFAEKKFVLMEADIPRRLSFDANLRRQNEALAKQYGVASFPTILVLTPAGEVVGGFQEGDKTVKDAIAQLESACLVDSLYNKAARQSGVARARTLYEAYMLMPETKGFAAVRESLRARVLADDPENVTGIHDVAAVVEQAKRFAAERAGVRLRSPELGRLLEQQLREALPANRPAVMLERCHYAMGVSETVDDIITTRKMFEEVVPLLPEEQAAEIRQYLEQFFQDPEKLLRTLKANRPKA